MASALAKPRHGFGTASRDGIKRIQPQGFDASLSSWTTLVSLRRRPSNKGERTIPAFMCSGCRPLVHGPPLSSGSSAMCTPTARDITRVNAYPICSKMSNGTCRKPGHGHTNSLRSTMNQRSRQPSKPCVGKQPPRSLHECTNLMWNGLGKIRSSLSDFVEFVEPLHAHNARTNRTKFTHRARVDMR